MTTYSHMIKVSADPTLTNSQKFHELFRTAAWASIADSLPDWADPTIVPADFMDHGQVLAHDADGQALLVRLQGNSYYFLDFGSGEAEDLVLAVNDMDQEVSAEVWASYLDTEDTPLAFYRGGFIDQDLEAAFLGSFPG